jgi:hypothetical protein
MLATTIKKRPFPHKIQLYASLVTFSLNISTIIMLWLFTLCCTKICIASCPKKFLQINKFVPIVTKQAVKSDVLFKYWFMLIIASLLWDATNGFDEIHTREKGVNCDDRVYGSLLVFTELLRCSNAEWERSYEDLMDRVQYQQASVSLL